MEIGILIIFICGFVFLAMIFASDEEPERHGVGGGKSLPTCHAIEQGKRCVRLHCDVHHTIHHLHIEDLDQHAA